MKKILFILAFIIMAIAFSGCKPVEKATNMTGTGGAAYIGGTQGLAISFLANAPPSIVYDQPKDQPANQFDISVRVENKGEYEIPAEKCNIELSGIDPASFGITTTRQSTKETLMPTRRSGGQTIAGTFTIVTTSPVAYRYPVSGQLGPFNLRATACYEYKTEATSNVCILKDLVGTTRREGLCKPNEKKTVENSGAPVGVQELEQSVTGTNSIALAFIIKQVGVGLKTDVIFQNNGQKCDPNQLSEQNKVGVTVKLGETDITSSCSGINGGLATLYGDTGAQIRCTQTLGTERGDYVQPVKITLTYDYMQYIDQKLTVKQVGT